MSSTINVNTTDAQAPAINSQFADGALRKWNPVNVPVENSPMKFLSLPVIKYVDAGFGLGEAYLGQQMKGGKIIPWGLKVITEKGESISKPVTNGYALIPNQVVLELVEKTGYPISKIDYARDDRAMFVTLKPVNFVDAKESGLGDAIGAGAQIRNSVDASVGFGVDSYTLRLRCLNGATARHKELSFVMKHRGDANSLLKKMKAAIEETVQNTEKLIAYYRKSNEIKVTEAIAQEIAKIHIPKQYQPDHFEVTRVKNKATGKESATVKFDGEQTVWQLFNDFTDKISHSKQLSNREGLSPATESAYGYRLHNVLIQAVTQKRGAF